MKKIALLLFPLSLAAQEPLTYEAFGKLYSIGNFGQGPADEFTDLVLIDQATGTFQVGFSQADQAVIWTQATESGQSNISGLAVGQLQNDDRDEFALTSPFSNRVSLFETNQSTLTTNTRHLYPAEPGTEQITPFSINANSPVDLLVFGNNGLSATSQAFEGTNSLWQGTEINRFEQPRTIDYDKSPGGDSKLVYRQLNQIFSADPTPVTITNKKALTGIVTTDNTRLTYGFFDGSNNAHLLFFDRGTQIARSSRITQDLAGWTTPATLNFPKPLEALVTVARANQDRLVALYEDRTASLFSYNGTSLTQITSLPGNHDLIAPLGAGQFLSKNGNQWQTLNANDGALIEAGVLPTTVTGSNVLFVSGEPFVNPDASPLFSAQVGQWTTVASGANSNWNVTALTQTANGLGNPSTQPVSPNPGSEHALVNQFLPEVSVSLLNGPPGAATPEVFITPGGGNFLPVEDESLEIPVSFSTTLDAAQVFYRLGTNGPWIETTGSLSLNTATTVQAFARKGNVTSPVQSAVFSSLIPASLSPGDIIDFNNNGLSDQWEESFGITDPLGDEDNDGANNLEEFENQTDPQDPLSGSIVVSGQLTAQFEEGKVILRWPVGLAGLNLESSENLENWSVVLSGITQEGSFFEFEIVSPTKGFYRLR